MSRRAPNNKVDVVLGAQWGDEGKGKLVDMLSVDMDITARCAGGNNAGHTVVADGIKVITTIINILLLVLISTTFICYQVELQMPIQRLLWVLAW